MTNPRPYRMAAGLVQVCALLALAVPLAAAPLSESLFATNWYTVLIMDSRSGYSCQTIRHEGQGVETVEQTVLRVKMGEASLTASREERRHYDADLRLVSIEHKADQVGRKVQISATRQGDTMRYVKQSPDGTARGDVPLPAGFGSELQVLQAISDGALKPGWAQSFTTFDCDLLKVDTISMTALEAVQTPRPGWLVSAKSKLLGLETRTWIAADGTLLRQEVPSMMGMALQLATEQEALRDLSPLLLATSIPVNRELGSPQELTQVVLGAVAHTGSAADMIPSTPRQTVTERDGKVEVTVRSETPPELTAKLPFTGPELQPFLQPGDLAQSQNPRLKAKAAAILGGETDAWQAALKLIRWVNHEMRKVPSEPRPISALEILDTMRGDCTEHAILLAALAQAAGLPAKMAAGLAYDRQAYHYHAWNELYVGRWVEVDATWGEDTVDAGHLQISAAALDSASMARLSLAAGRTMGSLELQIISHEAKP